MDPNNLLWLRATSAERLDLRRLADANAFELGLDFGFAMHRALDLLDLAQDGDQLARRNLDHALAQMREFLRRHVEAD